MRKTLILASRNRKKRAELEAIIGNLPVRILTLDDFPDIPDPVEDGETFLENAAKKALFVARATGTYTLADDSGLEVDALGGRPGVHSARYAGCDDKESRDLTNNRKLLREMERVPESERTARFRCAIVLAGPSPDVPHEIVTLGESEGTVEGKMLTEPRGLHGFGYDPLFYSEEVGSTFAEARAEDKNQISHRARALAKIAPLLRRIFGA
jgi:XTP/dITP diphosphohydrolase